MNGDALASKNPGDKLEPEEAKELGRLIGELLASAAKARPGGPRERAEVAALIAAFLTAVDYKVERDHSFIYKGSLPEPVVFDVAGTQGRETLYVQALKEPTAAALEAFKPQIQVLDAAGERASFCLGTDLINHPLLLLGPVGSLVKELMEERAMGVILADKDCMLICESYAQLNLQEMPTFWASQS